MRTWLITGGVRGLGRALTLRALTAGDAVVATVRGDHTLPPHERLTVVPLDVRDRTASFAVVEDAASGMGSLHVLVNNAGYGLVGAIQEASENDAREIIETNLLGPLWLSQAAVPIMRAQGRGHIVQISTVGAVGTMPTMGLYNSSKWGLEGFSEAVAAEVRELGMRVSLVEPGALDTEWAGSSMRFSEPLPVYDGLRSRLFGARGAVDVVRRVDGRYESRRCSRRDLPPHPRRGRRRIAGADRRRRPRTGPCRARPAPG